MSETEPISQPVDVDFNSDDAFGKWLEGSSIAQRSVVIYSKPQLYSQFQDLERRMENLQAAVGEDSSQSDPEIEQLEEEYRRLYDEWMASKSTWFVHGLSDEDRDKLVAGNPVIDELPEKPTDAQKNTHERKVAAALRDQYMRTISVALERIELGTGQTVTAITPAQVKAMADKIGPKNVDKLMLAIALANAEEEEVPAPKLRKPSETDQA